MFCTWTLGCSGAAGNDATTCNCRLGNHCAHFHECTGTCRGASGRANIGTRKPGTDHRLAG
jgi:hypothetical protein